VAVPVAVAVAALVAELVAVAVARLDGWQPESAVVAVPGRYVTATATVSHCH
jgi:hypothetical protein